MKNTEQERKELFRELQHEHYINEMIYKTISTKLNRNPKYKEALEAAGFTVYDSDWSGCGCWTVRNDRTGRTVLFSRDYGKRKRLYGRLHPSQPIESGDYRKVDFVSLLNCERNGSLSPAASKYRILRIKIKKLKEGIRYQEKNMEGIRSMISGLEADLRQAEKWRSGYMDALCELREQIPEKKILPQPQTD